ncbi:MAG: hypothetical protein EOS23_23940 [Mesorhizobium sp.]|nr:MAG: hypothetical protein EOS23_23940 [Mesorhizobium sp.]
MRAALAANPDATVALSETALTAVIQKALANPITAHDSGKWGPFEAGYDLELYAEGGRVELINAAQQINLNDVSFWGNANLRLSLNLGNVLPRICIPPDRICIRSPWGGEICTPQVCVDWPRISVPIPLPILRMKLSPFFQLAAEKAGDNWDILMKVFPASLLSLRPDLEYYLVDRIINPLRETVRRVLSGIPLIGGLIANLVNSVLSALRSVVSGIIRGISELVRQVIIMINLFSPTIPFKIASMPARQIILPKGDVGEGEVSLTISDVSTTVADPEIQLGIAFA